MPALMALAKRGKFAKSLSALKERHGLSEEPSDTAESSLVFCESDHDGDMIGTISVLNLRLSLEPGTLSWLVSVFLFSGASLNMLKSVFIK